VSSEIEFQWDENYGDLPSQFLKCGNCNSDL